MEEQEGKLAGLTLDNQSTISADSIVNLTPQQRMNIINKFARALIRDLPTGRFVFNGKPTNESTFSRQFEGLIKGYSKQLMQGPARQSRRRETSKAIRILRNNILDKFYGTLADSNESERRSYPSIVQQATEFFFPEKNAVEKVYD